jgi:hypothetical protein
MMNEYKFRYKRLLNHSEKIAQEVINKVLQGTRFTVLSQVPLRKLVEYERNELSTLEWRTYSESSIDFVVINEESYPILAVEFDGPSHDLYPKKKAADIRKNRLCYNAEIPLFRIGDEQVREEDKVSILEFIVYRAVNWYLKRDEIYDTIQEDIDQMDAEQIESLTAERILDPSIDPGFIYDCAHLFSGSHEVAARLGQKYRIKCEMMNVSHIHVSNPNFVVSYIGGSTMAMSSGELKVTARCRLKNISELCYKITPSEGIEFEASYSPQIDLIIEDDFLSYSDLQAYYNERRKWPIGMQFFPGLSANTLGEHLSEYYALKRVEEWAEKHLTEEGLRVE